MCNPLLFLSFHFFKLEKFLKLWFLPARWGRQNLSKMEILLSFLLVTTSLHQNWLKWIYRAESHAVPGLVDAAERSVLIANSKLCAAQGNPFPFSSSPPPPCRPMRPLAPPGCPPAPPPSSLCRFAAHPWFLEVTVVVDILSDLSQKWVILGKLS